MLKIIKKDKVLLKLLTNTRKVAIIVNIENAQNKKRIKHITIKNDQKEG